MKPNTPVVVSGFPIDADVFLRKTGTHHDTTYQVTNHGRRDDEYTYGEEPRGTWCYYVLIGEDALSQEDFNEFWLPPTDKRERSSGRSEPIYSYYSARFADADWHGGVTFYEKGGGIDGGERYVRIGCDFAHYWDEGRSYAYETVEGEAKATIDALHKLYSFKRRCAWTGIWLPKEQMVERDGRLYSPQGDAARSRA